MPHTPPAEGASAQRHSANPPESTPLLLRPRDWQTPQIKSVIPAARDAIIAITSLPRERLTLVVALTVVLVIATLVFIYLMTRRR